MLSWDNDLLEIRLVASQKKRRNGDTAGQRSSDKSKVDVSCKRYIRNEQADLLPTTLY